MIETTFEELFTFEALYAAHRKSRASRRSKKTIVKFETSMLELFYSDRLVQRVLCDGLLMPYFQNVKVYSRYMG